MADLQRRLTDEDWFLEMIDQRAELGPRVRPRTAASAVLRTLAQRLTPGQAKRLYDALPPDIQQLFPRGLVPPGHLIVRFDDAEYLDVLARELAVSPAHAELIADSVFRAVREVLPSEVIDNVAAQLPRDLSDLWLGTRAPILGATVPYDTARWELETDITNGVPLPVGVDATRALVSVMRVFTQRLSRGEARDVLLGLPPAVRPPLARYCLDREEEAVVFSLDELVHRVADDLGTDVALADQIVRVVLTAVKRMLPLKEQDDIASQLPVDLRALWEDA